MTRAIEVLAWALAFVAAVIVYIAAAVMAWPIKWTGRGLAWLLRWSVGTMGRACDVLDGERLRTPKGTEWRSLKSYEGEAIPPDGLGGFGKHVSGCVWRGFDYGAGQGPPPADRISDEATPWPTKRETELCRAMRNAPRGGLAGLSDAMMQQGPTQAATADDPLESLRRAGPGLVDLEDPRTGWGAAYRQERDR